MRCARHFGAAEAGAQAAPRRSAPAPMPALRAPQQPCGALAGRGCALLRPAARCGGSVAALAGSASASAEPGALTAELQTFPRPAVKADYSKATIKARAGCLCPAGGLCPGSGGALRHWLDVISACLRAAGDRRGRRRVQRREPHAEE
jgi:hypothetical protein